MLIYLCNKLNATDRNGPCYTVSDSLANLLLLSLSLSLSLPLLPPSLAPSLSFSLSLSLSLSLLLIDAIDNSGMTFYYMDTSCQYEAGIM